MATILIVDDDKFTRTVLATIFSQDRAFKDFALVVAAASNGEEGLERFKRDGADIAIVDLTLPKMTGFETCRALRDAPGGEDLILVVTTVSQRNSADAKRKAAEYNARLFTKPYQLKDMTEYVATLLVEGLDDDSPVIEHVTAENELLPPMNGRLESRPLPAVLFDLLESQTSGTLHLQRGRMVKDIELQVGHPVSVTSNSREETLGHFLSNRGIISDEQQSAAVSMAAKQGLRVGQALLMQGVVTPEQLVEHLTAQIRHKLTQALRWPDGTWRLEPRSGPPSGARGNPIDAVTAVLQGLVQTARFDAIPPHIERLGDRPLRLNTRGKRLLPQIAQLVSRAFVSLWSDGTTTNALLASGLPPSQLYTAIDILLRCDALHADGIGNQASGGDIPASPMSVAALSEHSQVRRLPQAPFADNNTLYRMLFEETAVGATVGAIPLEVEEDADGVPIDLSGSEFGGDSGVVDVRAMGVDLARKAARGASDSDASMARRKLLEEYLRIQNIDHYKVLRVTVSATAAEISSSVVERRSKFSLDYFSRFDLGRDYAKLEDLHAAYDQAFETLLDDDKRAAYDREIAGGELDDNAPSLDAEISFRAGEDLVRQEHYAPAIAKYTRAIESAPNEADYHAALGWACFLAKMRSPRGADDARPHLTQALSINPDHAAANEYKGRIDAELGDHDVEATYHLERALDADPSRAGALEALEGVWRRRGELRPLERQYRKLIFRCAGRDSRIEAGLWVKLGDLYRTELDNPVLALVSYESAAKLGPDNPAVRAALAELQGGQGDRFLERSEMLRAHWRRDPTSPGPGRELIRAADQMRRPDAAYLAASVLVARGLADPEAEARYKQYRPRFLLRAQRQLDDEAWHRLRHPDDSPEVGALFELLAPAIHSVAAPTLADMDVDEDLYIDEEDLPAALVRIRSYTAHMLGVQEPRFYLRADFGHQIHVGATSPPVLLAGDDALAAPERLELSYRLGRAMTFLWPGRALGSSRPGRFLKRAVLAAFASGNPGSDVPDPDGSVGQLREAIETLDPAALSRVHELVRQLTSDNSSLNLSAWSRALARTAERVGLLLCGDVPAAVRFCRDDSGSRDELMDFAVSAEHMWLRQHIGVSIDV